eukprot:GEMP01041479.1.p1 GENE.GEMP01041479.1~~GEMP01041479.1.p1  ORF type:complete len:462 (+),score=107.05 GEMP01041479.1:94-1479(+)
MSTSTTCAPPLDASECMSLEPDETRPADNGHHHPMSFAPQTFDPISLFCKRRPQDPSPPATPTPAQPADHLHFPFDRTEGGDNPDPRYRAPSCDRYVALYQEAYKRQIRRKEVLRQQDEFWKAQGAAICSVGQRSRACLRHRLQSDLAKIFPEGGVEPPMLQPILFALGFDVVASESLKIGEAVADATTGLVQFAPLLDFLSVVRRCASTKILQNNPNYERIHHAASSLYSTPQCVRPVESARPARSQSAEPISFRKTLNSARGGTSSSGAPTSRPHRSTGMPEDKHDHVLWLHTSRSHTEERLRTLRQDKIDGELEPCTFRPQINRDTKQSVASNNRCELLYQRGLQTKAIIAQRSSFLKRQREQEENKQEHKKPVISRAPPQNAKPFNLSTPVLPKSAVMAYLHVVLPGGKHTSITLRENDNPTSVALSSQKLYGLTDYQRKSLEKNVKRAMVMNAKSN